MVMCWAPGGTHHNARETCKFFGFPKDPQIRKKWIQLIRRVDEPGPDAYICSCHFHDGNKDSGPEYFKHKEEKLFMFSSPEKKKGRTSKFNTSMEIGDSHEMAECSTEVGVLSEPPFSSQNVFHPEPQPCCSGMVQPEPRPSCSSEVHTEPQTNTSKVLLETENYFLKHDLQECKAKLSHLCPLAPSNLRLP